MNIFPNPSIFKKFNKYPSIDTIYELSKHRDISFDIFSELFDYYYDNREWTNEALDRLFTMSCTNKNANFAKVMSLRKFESRKYKVYFTSENIIHIYRISVI